jgi:hypothetical protein
VTSQVPTSSAHGERPSLRPPRPRRAFRTVAVLACALVLLFQVTGAEASSLATEPGSKVWPLAASAPANTSTLLGGAYLSDVDVRVRVKIDQRPTGDGNLFSVLIRHANGRDYGVQLRFAPAGGLFVAIQRHDAGTTSNLYGERLVHGLKSAAGHWVWLQVRAVGSSPTHISVRVWRSGSLRPRRWTASATDASDIQTGEVLLSAAPGPGAIASKGNFSYDHVRVLDLTGASDPTPAPTPDPSPEPTGAPVPNGYPANTHLRYVQTPSISLPGYLAPLVDPVWGTEVTRISSIPGQRQAYTKPQAWNADGSLLLLGYEFPGMLLDGNTYAVIDAQFHEPSTAVWSTVDPRLLYGTLAAAGTLRTVDPLFDQDYTTIHTFEGYTELSIGEGQGIISKGDRYVVLQGNLNGVEKLIVYDIANDAVIATKSFKSRPHWASISPSGDYVVARWSDPGKGSEEGTWQFDRNLNPIRQLWSDYGHGDFAFDTDGKEIFVQMTGDGVQKINLSSGARTTILSGGSAFDLGHVSGQAWSRPGWVYLSNYDAVESRGQIGCDQIVALKTDGSQTVEVFANVHHGAEWYDADPMATVSRDGTRVLFGSEWKGSNVFAYVAQVP